MKKILAAVAVVVAMSAGQSYALTLDPYLGDVSMKFDGVSYYNQDTTETQALYTMTSIGYNANGFPPSTVNIWNQGKNSEYIYGVATGTYDHIIVGNDIQNKGGSFAFYQFDHALSFTDFSTAMSLITTGTLVFQGNMTAGVLSSIYGPTIDSQTTVKQVYDSKTGQGKGEGYADLTAGGLAYDLFNSNSQAGDTDLYFLFDTELAGDNYYIIHDPVYGAAVPEPSTMMLLGAGVLGLGLYGRRRARKEA